MPWFTHPCRDSITARMYAHGLFAWVSNSVFSISGPTSDIARARMSVLMADVLINMMDVHNMTSFVDVHLRVSGKLSALLDIIICVMISALLYVIAAAFNECRSACSSADATPPESDNVQLIQRDVESSSH